MPQELAFSQSVALSFSLASAASVAPCCTATAFSITMNSGAAMMLRIGWVGSFSSMSTVWSSTTFMLSTWAMYCCGWSFRLITRSKEKRTSSAVIGVPVENFTPWRSLKRRVLPSACMAHSVASAGLMFT